MPTGILLSCLGVEILFVIKVEAILHPGLILSLRTSILILIYDLLRNEKGNMASYPGPHGEKVSGLFTLQ